jgi:hypothetical protein
MTAAVLLERFLALQDVEFTDPLTGRRHRVEANRGGFFSQEAVIHLVRAGKMKHMPDAKGSFTLRASEDRWE